MYTPGRTSMTLLPRFPKMTELRIVETIRAWFQATVWYTVLRQMIRMNAIIIGYLAVLCNEQIWVNL